MIEAKKAGKEVVTGTDKPRESNVMDLMAALQASIDNTKPSKKTEEKRKRPQERKLSKKLKNKVLATAK